MRTSAMSKNWHFRLTRFIGLLDWNSFVYYYINPIEIFEDSENKKTLSSILMEDRREHSLR
jgi:hypothetical protein